ncbi:type VI secretion protein [Sedimentimonas flavescens]|uniref:Type VI secretion protein n=1 Tax=Sedimentimonas flavescens TaxID=2851012 RepID=A0ABT2ZV18_9RHOB|nr:type VI secretion protein [Sedimentimonas flavescens]MCV2877586.1 type VI secretion protein [Sedimentimonas flavescens]
MGTTFFFGLFPLTALADISECATIEADLDRLACYDKISGRTPTTEVVAAPGDWSIEVKKSDFEDTTDVFMRVASQKPVSCGHFKGPQNITLLLRCKENTTSIFIATHCHLTSGHGGYGNVDIRLDDQKSFVSRMDDSTDNSALGLWSGSRSIPLIKQMLGKERMLVRFTPFSESPVTAEFNISGLDEAIKPLREACKW